MSFDDFEKISELGKGSFGSVYKVKRKKDGEVYALKNIVTVIKRIRYTLQAENGS